ncbi:flagellar hook-length control protein FliK [Paraclostridium bifermentans]|uniref:flagellar hook-length control protein FliK n=1 Tax=Paraclostridium bifermentans TaxID=1490 RepID=UPI00359C9E84
MNLNLNVSPNLEKIATGKSKTNSTSATGTGFDDIINSLDEINENGKDDLSGVEELIESLIANINTFKEIDINNQDINLKDLDLLKIISFEMDKVNTKIDEFDISKYLKNIEDTLESIDKNTDLKLNLDNKALGIKNDLQVNTLNDEKTIDMFERIVHKLNLDNELDLKKMSKKTDEKTIKIDNTIDKTQAEMIGKLNDQVKSLKSYEELNISTNSNKNSINDYKLDSDDKDLNVLTNILDDKGNLFNIQGNKMFTQNTSENPSLPVVTIRSDHMTEDFIKMVKYLKTNNLEEINVSMNPKGLGEMTIKLIKDSEATKIVISISKEDTYNLLNKNIGDINKHLMDLGIKAKDIVVAMKSNDENLFSENFNQQFGNREEQRKQKRHNNRQKNSIEEIEEIEISQQNFNILA